MQPSISSVADSWSLNVAPLAVVDCIVTGSPTSPTKAGYCGIGEGDMVTVTAAPEANVDPLTLSEKRLPEWVAVQVTGAALTLVIVKD
jgi:hypothetical protein